MQKRKVIILTVTFLAIIIAVYLVASLFNLIDSTFGIKNFGYVSPSIPIQQNGDLYTLTNHTQGFTVKRSNIVIDGNGYNSSLIIMDHVTNVTIKNLQLIARSSMYYKYSGIGLYLSYCSNNIISNCCFLGDMISLHTSHNNTISNNIDMQAYLDNSNYNTISNNELSGDLGGGKVQIRNGVNNLILRNNSTKIVLSLSALNNLFFGNRIGLRGPDNWAWLSTGIYTENSSLKPSQNMFVGNEIIGPFIIESNPGSGNLFYHNNFIDAWEAKYPYQYNGTNKWNTIDEGNYWNDYLGQDLNHDGIGDTPYIMNAFNQDNYPLMNPINIEDESQPNIT